MLNKCSDLHFWCANLGPQHKEMWIPKRGLDKDFKAARNDWVPEIRRFSCRQNNVIWLKEKGTTSKWGNVIQVLWLSSCSFSADVLFPRKVLDQTTSLLHWNPGTNTAGPLPLIFQGNLRDFPAEEASAKRIHQTLEQYFVQASDVSDTWCLWFSILSSLAL